MHRLPRMPMECSECSNHVGAASSLRMQDDAYTHFVCGQTHYSQMLFTLNLTSAAATAVAMVCMVGERGGQGEDQCSLLS